MRIEKNKQPIEMLKIKNFYDKFETNLLDTNQLEERVLDPNEINKLSELTSPCELGSSTDGDSPPCFLNPRATLQSKRLLRQHSNLIYPTKVVVEQPPLSSQQ